MAQAQAFVQACDDFRIQKTLQQFFEYNLNLYAIDLKTDVGGVKDIVEGGMKRDWIFQNLQSSIDNHQVNRIILFNHTYCTGYGGSRAFENLEAEVRQHEIQLRHAASDVKAKFPEKEVEAYLIVLGSSGEIKKVV